MQTLTITLALTSVLLLSGCSEETQDRTPMEAEHGHAHGAGGEKFTHFTEHTELFVEFAPLVVGESSAFAAHLTTLADFRAITAGKVTVRLQSEGQPDEVFSVDGPTQPGIFRPEAIPKIAGERELSIEVATSAFKVTHILGPVTVFPDRAAAEAEPPAHEDEGIVFTKEQQWKVEFATSEVITRPMRASVKATGTVRARPDGESMITAPAAGLLQPAGSFPHLGETVKKGQLLGYLIPRLGGETDLATLRAEASKAQVEEQLASEELTRLEGLYREEAIPEKRLLEARAKATSAQAHAQATRQRLAQYSGGGGGVPLRAPVAGTLVDLRLAPGAFVEEGALLFHIADRRRLWLELRVAEADAMRLANPSGAAFRPFNAEHTIEITAGKNGKLIAVGGVVDAVTRTVPVIFEFPAPEQHLPLGMAVQAQIFAGSARDSAAVPASSVLDEGGIPTLFVQSSGESFERVTVRLGARDGEWVEVLEGLAPGQRVVSRGAYLVKLAATKTGEIGHGHAH